MLSAVSDLRNESTCSVGSGNLAVLGGSRSYSYTQIALSAANGDREFRGMSPPASEPTCFASACP